MHLHLTTDRLLLRRFTETDVDNLTDLDSDPEVMHFITGGRPTPRAEIVKDIIPAFLGYYERSDHFGFWAAALGPTDTFIGWFHLRSTDEDSPGDPELGYRLRRDAWGLGYATEGSRALIDKAFRATPIKRIHAETMAVNGASRRVMEKSGLRYCRTFHQDWPFLIPGHEHGDVEYGLTRPQWQTARDEGGAGVGSKTAY